MNQKRKNPLIQAPEQQFLVISSKEGFLWNLNLPLFKCICLKSMCSFQNQSDNLLNGFRARSCFLLKYSHSCIVSIGLIQCTVSKNSNGCLTKQDCGKQKHHPLNKLDAITPQKTKGYAKIQ